MSRINLLLIVENLKKSSQFYMNYFNQRILFHFGSAITFESGLTLQTKDSFSSLIGKKNRIKQKPFNCALYFEEKDLELLRNTLKRKVEWVHDIEEQPWGQRVFRLLDPDGHLIEVGEPMKECIKRLAGEGMSNLEIEKKSGVPQEAIEATLELWQ